MTQQEKWPAGRAEEPGRERGYGGEYERGSSYSSSRQERGEPYEERDERGRFAGRREEREEEEWQGPPPGRSSYGPRFEGFRGEDVRRAARERYGAEEQPDRPAYQGGYEASRGGEERGSSWSGGGRYRYGDSGGSERWYGDDTWRGSQMRYGDESRGSGRGGMERPYSQGSYGRQGSYGGQGLYGGQGSQGGQGFGEGRRERDWGSSAGSDWGGSERSGSGSQQSRGMQRESQRGKGPKNYRRSDERIREDICERLQSHMDIDASDIDVKVTQGEVTLTGEALSRAEKRMAEDCAEDVSGVQDVTNQIRVRQAGGHERSSSSSESGESGTSTGRSSGSQGDSSREKARPTASR